MIDNELGTLFKGKMMNMPIKKSAIIEKSIDLFDDDDPCIIHTSYVIKHFADQLLTLFNTLNTSSIEASKYQEELHFLDVDFNQSITIKRM